MLRQVHRPCGKTPCPKCGCADTQPLGTFTRFGKEYEKARCRHCGKQFRAPIPPEPERPQPQSPSATTDSEQPNPEASTGVPAYHSATHGGAKCPNCGRIPWRVQGTATDTSHGIRVAPALDGAPREGP